ncbi:MAG: DUF58 domain-containing protein [Mariniblastus sp.]|nr:DUF58 domain-containing protein [Mariniblastus sp.]
MQGQLEHIDPLDWRQFILAVNKLADNFNYGTDASPFLGSGVEYVQSRQYQYGDPIRSIDWRVTARTGKVFVKEFETPKQMPCYLLLDTSASMIVSSQKRSKYATGLHIAGGLAFACLDRVSPVGMTTTGSDHYSVEPSLSKDQIMQWLHELRRFQMDQSTVLTRRLNELSARLNNRALIIVISDLHEPKALNALKLAAQAHDVVVLQLRDPAERQISGTGYFRAREPETGREFVTHGKRTWIDYETITQELKRRQIDHLLIDIDIPFAHKIRWFFKSRGILGNGAR